MLKEHILTPPKVPASNPYSTFMSIEGAAVGADAAKKWKALTPEQQREYAEKGRNLHALGLQNREKWVKSLDPLEVYKANKARKHLKRLSGGGRKFAVLKDPRMPKRPTPIGAAFLRDQWNAGTFINPDGSKMPAVLALKHSRDLYEKLSAAEKKVYDDQFAAERVVYKKAMAEFLGDISKL
ncbi:hypothetical protein HOY82DRAFT_499118 [Tuber indicum]|nr:hypothetical protein HOY82DRAFT_499118 [Tuber indicum]